MRILLKRRDNIKAPVALAPESVVNLAIFFTLFVCVLFVAIDLLQIQRSRTEHIDDANAVLGNMSQAMWQHAEDTIKSADASLIGIVGLIGAEGLPAKKGARLASLMAQGAIAASQIHAYFICDDQGRSVLDSTPMYRTDNVSDREYFQFHRDNDSREAHIGGLIRNRITEAWTFTVSRRFNYPDGRFGGVVAAAIDLDYFKAFYDTFNMGRDGSIVFGLDDGTVLVRRPSHEKYTGRDMKDVPVFRDHIAKNRAGLATFKSAVDGVVRSGSYRHLDKYPLFVFASFSREGVLAGWFEYAMMHGAGISMLVIALLLLGFGFANQIKLRAKDEFSLISGRDILCRQNASLRQLAMEDGLTGIANRRHFDLVLKKELKRATRHAGSLALVMIDVDFFKQYNDLYGHAEGDTCLRRIGRVLSTVAHRPGDLPARYGGEEFAILLPDATKSGALQLAERVREKIMKLNIPHSGSDICYVTVSVGVEAFDPVREGDLAETRIKRADSALYQAKKQGRNKVCAAVAQGDASQYLIRSR